MAGLRSVIRTAEDLQSFYESSSFESLWKFITDLNESCIERTLTKVLSDPDIPPHIKSTHDLLAEFQSLITARFPPVENSKSRFGNPAFKDWLDHIQNICYTRLTGIISEDKDSGIMKEAAAYLCNSFGNWQRIDYGTGHELHFLMFMYCLHQMYPNVELVHYSLYLFPRYLELMRALESIYWLEPAGSHGVWGLDDYRFLPFLFGSAQLCSHQHLRPSSIHNPELITELSKDYLYFDAIRVINSINQESR